MVDTFRSGALTPHRSFLFISLFFLIGIIYGNFIPFNFSPSHSLYETWDRFLHIPYSESRAGWEANLLIYIPPAFFLCGWLSDHCPGGLAKVSGAIVTLLFYSIVAVGIEFTQLYFPPRTVTLNDIIAEISGTVLGIIFWLLFGTCFFNAWQAIRAGGRPALLATLSLYVLGYVIFCLFPFDFILSFDELRRKLGSGIVSFLLASSGCDSGLHCLIKHLAVVVVNIPIGILLGLLWGTKSTTLRKVLIFGLIASISIELVKFFEESGIAQSISVLTRPLGMGMGLWLLKRQREKPLRLSPATIRILLSLSIPPYLLMLAALNGWLNLPWLHWSEGLRRLGDLFGELRWLPFYYHYFSTPTEAMASLVRIGASYAFIGLGLWLWRGLPQCADRLLLPALLAGGCAVVVEAGKLFLPGGHPDQTNILIAATSAVLTYSIAAWMKRWNQATVPQKRRGIRDRALS
jgi:glycopeptide antibiotics resistance protein